MYFNHAFKKVFLGTGTYQKSASGTTASELTTVGNFGLYNASTFVNLNATTGTNFILASSSLTPANDKIGPFHGGYAESSKSKTINPKYISGFYKVSPKTATNSIVAVGLTAGLNNTPYAACTKTYKCDETYYLRVDVKGSPALRFLGRNAYYVADYYTGCCATGQTSVDPAAVMVGWAKSLAEDPRINQFISPVAYVSTNAGASYIAYVNPTAANVGKVIEIKITNGGSSYSSAPSVVIGTQFAATTAYALNEQVAHLDKLYTVTVAGTSGASGTAPVHITGSVVSGTVTFAYTGSAATATATISSGVVNAITINVSGSGYTLSGSVAVTFSGGSGSGAAAYAVKAISWDSFVEDTTPTADNKAGIIITGAYVDTKFGDCSFQPTDHFEKEGVIVLASEIDQVGDPCAFGGTCVNTLQLPKQGEGFGETVIRDLILSERYAQNHFNDDPRIREILNGNAVFGVNRNNSYFRYMIVHNVPRFSNPTSTFDNDQYVCEIIASSVQSTFESDMASILTAAGNGVQLQSL